MVLLTNIIPAQGFEIVLNKIGAIVFEELTNQKAVDTDFTADFAVFIERQQPYEKSEDVVIIAALASGAYSGKTQSEVMGDYTYYLDVYTTGIASDGVTGNDSSRQKLHMILGKIRAILNSTVYKTLGFPSGLIGSTMVSNIQFLNNYGEQDASFVRMARVTFTASVREAQEMWAPIPLLGNDTQCKLDLTDKGFQITFNNS